jgi:tetratricopeptide (TPR) repeat protein
MPRPVQRQHPLTGRGRTEPAPSPAPRTPQAAVLGLQALAGNAATAHLIARAPTAEKPITAPGITGMQQFNERAYAHFKAGRYEQAIANWAEAFKLHPISTFLRDQGEALQRLGRSDEAAKMYEQYLANGPLTSDVPKYRSRIKKLRGQTIPPGEDDDEPEIKAVGKAGARDWFDRGQEAFQAKRFGKAAESFRQANRLWAKPEFIFNEASALEAGDHKRAAANAYEHYLVRNPGAKDEAEILEKIKQLRAKAPPQGPDALIDPEDEASEMPGVTSKGKSAASEWVSRATVAWKLGEFRRVYDAFVAAYAAFPHPDFVFNQASALDMLGNADAAIQAYERYIALAPRAKDVPKVRKRIALLRANPAAVGPKRTP